jgi:hypothetical protein
MDTSVAALWVWDVAVDGVGGMFVMLGCCVNMRLWMRWWRCEPQQLHDVVWWNVVGWMLWGGCCGVDAVA